MIVRLIDVYVNNIVFTLKIRLCLYKIVINYLLSPFLCYFLLSIRSLFLTFFCFLIYINVYPKYYQHYKKDVRQ